MSVYLDFLKNFIDFFNDLPARARFRNENEQTNCDTGVHLSTHHHKHHTIFDEPALLFSHFGSKKAKYDENDLLESPFSKRNNF